MPQELVIEGNFRLIEVNEYGALLECPRCGCEFDTCRPTEKNLIFSFACWEFVPLCPLCGTQQRGQ